MLLIPALSNMQILLWGTWPSLAQQLPVQVPPLLGWRPNAKVHYSRHPSSQGHPRHRSILTLSKVHFPKSSLLFPGHSVTCLVLLWPLVKPPSWEGPVFSSRNPVPLQSLPSSSAFVDLYTSGAGRTREFVLLIFICLLCAGKNSLWNTFMLANSLISSVAACLPPKTNSVQCKVCSYPNNRF